VAYVLRRRRKDEPDSVTDDNVRIETDEHAWWAAREEFDTNAVPHGRSKQKAESEGPKHSSFEDYFSTESLFDWSGEDANGLFDEKDPYVVLGLPPSATWEVITAMHRKLAKQHHPDRLVSATDEDREASDERIRDLNIAYTELRRRKGK
jgi:DnaJ-domain-containing protein 1